MARQVRPLHTRYSDNAEPVVNLTSLIDVVFVVLIMFIVIAPLLEIDKIALAKAPHHQGEFSSAVQESSLVSISVNANNEISFNKRKVNIVQLQLLLKHAFTKHPGMHPQLLHDKEASFGTYQTVKNAVEEAGYKELDIILMPAG